VDTEADTGEEGDTEVEEDGEGGLPEGGAVMDLLTSRPMFISPGPAQRSQRSRLTETQRFLFQNSSIVLKRCFRAGGSSIVCLRIG